MRRCSYCRSTIIVGGVRDGEQRFCNDRCHQSGVLVALSNRVDPSDVRSPSLRSTRAAVRVAVEQVQSM